MKLLLDQNLSRKLINQIESTFPESQHVTTALSERSEDRDIWLYAQENGFVIVTKDNDFEQRSILLGHPPKVIWIRLGNCRTSDIAALIERSTKAILAFGDDVEKSILPIP